MRACVWDRVALSKPGQVAPLTEVEGVGCGTLQSQGLGAEGEQWVLFEPPKRDWISL